MTPEETDRLFSVYAAERQDDQNSLVVAFAIATAGLTYIIAAAAFLVENCDRFGCSKLPSWVQLLAPSIAIIFFGFLVLNVAATRLRSVHLQRLEEELEISLPKTGGKAPRFHTESGIVYRPDRPFSEPHERLVFAAVSYISYGLATLILISFTWVVLVVGPWTAWKKGVAALYGFFEVIEIVGLLVPLRSSHFLYNDPSDTRNHQSQS